MLYASDFDDVDDRDCPYKSGKSLSSERRAFTLLSSVCWDWYLTLIGHPLSPTPLWVKHQLMKLIKREYTPPPHTLLYTYSLINSTISVV